MKKFFALAVLLATISMTAQAHYGKVYYSWDWFRI